MKIEELTFDNVDKPPESETPNNVIDFAQKSEERKNVLKKEKEEKLTNNPKLIEGYFRRLSECMKKISLSKSEQEKTLQNALEKYDFDRYEIESIKLSVTFGQYGNTEAFVNDNLTTAVKLHDNIEKIINTITQTENTTTDDDADSNIIKINTFRKD